MEGNRMKMRDALEAFVESVEWLCEGYESGRLKQQFGVLLSAARAALSAPARNCDVGTADEQVERFKAYCESNMQYFRDMFGTHEGAGGWDCREDCPIGKMIDKNDSLCDHCELVWAQMPYEEGGV